MVEKLMGHIERFLRYLALKNLWFATAIVFVVVFTFIGLSVVINSTFDRTIRENLAFFMTLSALFPAVFVALIYLLFGHRAIKKRF